MARIGDWDFTNGTGADACGKWGTLELKGDAELTNAGLKIGSGGWARVRGYTGPTIREKTLAVWFSLEATSPSVSVRGVGENDWSKQRDQSEELMFHGPLKPSSGLLKYVSRYSGGDQRSKYMDPMTGWPAPALALHGANLAAASGAEQLNFMGHSRGAVECIMAAWFIYAYGNPNIPINIFAIDPVPGPGRWYGILTQLPPNVANYVGIYSWDHCIQPQDRTFTTRRRAGPSSTCHPVTPPS